MQVAIDKFGRMVLPKAVRVDFNLETGAVLDVEEQGDSIVLRPLDRKSVVREDGGVWVYGGDVDGDVADEVRRHRQARLDHLG